MRHFKIFEHGAVRLFEQKARDRFELENKTNNEYDLFWGSSKTNIQMPSRAKEPFEYFRAFQVTSRIEINPLVTLNRFNA